MNDSHRHEGYEEAIDNLKKEDLKFREDLKDMEKKVSNIMTRLNIILGGVAVTAVMLALNLVFK